MKRNALKEDVQIDPFLQRGRATAAWLGRRTHLLRLGLLVVVLICVSLAWVSSNRRKKAERASVAFAEGLARLTESVSTADSDAPKAHHDLEANRRSGDEATRESAGPVGVRDYSRAKSAFSEAVRLVGTRGVGATASILLAETDIRQGRRDLARTRLQALVRDISPNRPLYFLAAQSLSALEESDHDTDAAAGPLRGLAEEHARPYSDWAAWTLARLELMRGDKSQAEKLLERLETEFSQTSRTDDIVRLRARLSRPASEKAPS